MSAKTFERFLFFTCIGALAGAVMLQIVLIVGLRHEVSDLKKDAARLERNVLNIAVETGLTDVFELKSAKVDESP